MQRYSGGLKVPLTMIDVYVGQTTSVTGTIQCTLTYTPKNPDGVSVQYGYGMLLGNRHLLVQSVAGKVVTIYVWRGRYDKPDTPTAAGEGSTGGGAHTHAITATETDIVPAMVASELQLPIVITYMA